MQKYWDVVVVGLLTLIVTSIVLIVQPGYSPVEISEEIDTVPINVEEEVEGLSLPEDQIVEEEATEAVEPTMEQEVVDDTNVEAEASEEAAEATDEVTEAAGETTTEATEDTTEATDEPATTEEATAESEG